MSFYRVNAATIYRVAHDTSITAEERQELIAQLLRLMSCETLVTVEELQPVASAGDTASAKPS